jgi:PAS domain-containing protein
MDARDKLLEALGELGEAAAFYKGQYIQKVNNRFAELVERSREECEGLPINDLVHNESIEMIQDFIRQRAQEVRGVPTTYRAFFKTPSTPKVEMQLYVLKLKKSASEVLVILRKK